LASKLCPTGAFLPSELGSWSIGTTRNIRRYRETQENISLDTLGYPRIPKDIPGMLGNGPWSEFQKLFLRTTISTLRLGPVHSIPGEDPTGSQEDTGYHPGISWDTPEILRRSRECVGYPRDSQGVSGIIRVFMGIQGIPGTIWRQSG
jgi:hypothetical protein